MKKPRRHVNNKEFRAERIFTDREEPLQTFWNNYDGLKDMPADDRNIKVLVYYGIGGIGKTRLLKEIKVELEKKGKNVVDFDFEEAQQCRFVLESLKNLLVNKYGFEFPLFEYSLYYYRLKIGEDANAPEIKSFISKSPFLSTLIDLTDSIQGIDIISKTLKAADTGLAYVRNLVKNHKTQLIEMRLKDARQLYDDMAMYFSLDMEDNLKNKNEPLVILFDTYERLVNEMCSIGESLDNDLWLRGPDGLVQNIPNVLWVIAGRERLKWERFESDWEGSLEQHMLGTLSYEDAVEFLENAGIREKELRSGLYSLTKGTPVYLDLCVDRYNAVIEKGKVPTLSDFGQDVHSLVGRLVKYMDDNEKQLLYVLSCLKMWDDELVNAVCINLFNGFSFLLYEKVKEFSFILSIENNLYRVNQLVGEVLYQECPKEIRMKTLDSALDYCHKKLDDLSVYDSLYPTYTQAFLQYILYRYTCDLELAETFYKIFLQYFEVLIETAQFEKAKYLLQIAESNCNEKGLSQAVLDIFNSDIYNSKGDYQKAYGYALKGTFNIYMYYGKINEMTLWAGTLLGKSLSGLGRYKEAKKLYEEVLPLSKKILGADNSITISTMNDLAGSLRDVGQYVEALKIYKKIVLLKSKVLGKDHNDTMIAMNNLAGSLRDVSRNKAALVISAIVFEARKRTLGEEHPITIGTMHNFAVNLWDNGKYDKALEYFEKSLTLNKKVLGENHPYTVNAMNDLGAVLINVGRYEEALKIFKKVLLLNGHILGKNHPHTLNSINNLAFCLSRIGRYNAALILTKILLKWRRLSLGENHPQIIKTKHLLANCFKNVGKNKEALKLYSEAVLLSERILGKEHPYTLFLIKNLSNYE